MPDSLGQVIVPDDPQVISSQIRQMIAEGAELVMVTGGSVWLTPTM